MLFVRGLSRHADLTSARVQEIVFPQTHRRLRKVKFYNTVPPIRSVDRKRGSKNFLFGSKAGQYFKKRFCYFLSIFCRYFLMSFFNSGANMYNPIIFGIAMANIIASENRIILSSAEADPTTANRQNIIL